MAVCSYNGAVFVLFMGMVAAGCVKSESQWSEWYNTDSPFDEQGADVETLYNISMLLKTVPCEVKEVSAVECRQVGSDTTFSNQASFRNESLYVPCNLTGLVCRNQDQFKESHCADYEIRVRCPDPNTPPIIKGNGTQQGVYNTSNESTTRKDSTTSDISANGGFIAMAAGGSVILPLVCVLVIQLRKSKRLERQRREQARQAAEDLRRNEDQSNSQDRPPAYEDLFGSTAVEASGGGGSGGGGHPTESMSLVSGSLSIDSGLGMEGDHSLDRVVTDSPARILNSRNSSGSSLGPLVSFRHGRMSVVSTTSTTSTLLSFDSSVPGSPNLEPASQSVSILSPAIFLFPSASLNTSTAGPFVQYRSASPMAASDNSAISNSAVPSNNTSHSSQHSDSSDNPTVPIAVVSSGDVLVVVNEVSPSPDSVPTLPTIVVTAEQPSRRSSSWSSVSQAASSPRDVLLPIGNSTPEAGNDVTTTSGASAEAAAVRLGADPSAEGQAGAGHGSRGGSAGHAAREYRRHSLQHNGPPPTYDSPNYSALIRQTLPFSVLAASNTALTASSLNGGGRTSRSLSTSAAPLLSFLANSFPHPASSSATDGGSSPRPAVGGQPQAPVPVVTAPYLPLPPTFPPPPPTPLPQRPARRFLGMHLSIFDLMAAIYQNPDSTPTPPPTYDDALKILAAKLSKQEERNNQNENQNQVV